MAKVMGGIAEALIATGVGIFVAIPAVVAYNVVQKKAGEIENNAQSLARLITAWLHTHPRPRTPTSPSSRPRATANPRRPSVIARSRPPSEGDPSWLERQAVVVVVEGAAERSSAST